MPWSENRNLMLWSIVACALGCYTPTHLEGQPFIYSPASVLRDEMDVVLEQGKTHIALRCCLPADLHQRERLLAALHGIWPSVQIREYTQAAIQLAEVPGLAENDAAEVQIVCGVLYMSSGRIDEALEALNSVIATGTADQVCRARFHRAMLFGKEGRTEEADQDRQSILSNCPDLPIQNFTHENRGIIM